MIGPSNTDSEEIDQSGHPPECSFECEGLIGSLAEIFVADILRLEEEHGFTAKQMLGHYRGDRSLLKKEGDEEGSDICEGEQCRAGRRHIA